MRMISKSAFLHFRSGFSLLEVVIAMAMLAMIALPALGLAALAVRQTNSRLSAGTASELKRRVDVYLDATRTNSSGIFDSDTFLKTDLTLWASKDLHFVDTLADSSTSFTNGLLPTFKIVVKDGAVPLYNEATDAYRRVNYIVTWPYNDDGREPTEQLLFTSVFRR